MEEVETHQRQRNIETKFFKGRLDMWGWRRRQQRCWTATEEMRDDGDGFLEEIKIAYTHCGKDFRGSNAGKMGLQDERDGISIRYIGESGQWVRQWQKCKRKGASILGRKLQRYHNQRNDNGGSTGSVSVSREGATKKEAARPMYWKQDCVSRDNLLNSLPYTVC